MEYTFKAEDIGNSAMSEDDNTNKPQNDYGSDCVYGDRDRKSDGEDNSDGDTTRYDGCDSADGNSCNAEVTNNHVGAAIHDKADDGYDEYDDHDCVNGDRKIDVVRVIQKEVMDVMSMMTVMVILVTKATL